MDEATFREALIARLNVIVRLLLARPELVESPKITDMARTLRQMDLTPSEIGAILGKSSNYISATLRSATKAKGKAKR